MQNATPPIVPNEIDKYVTHGYADNHRKREFGFQLIRNGKHMGNTVRLVILFDGSCNFCTACAELLRVLDWRHRLHCLPFQAPGVPQSHGLTVAQCEQVIWAISSNGPRYQGTQAVSAALDAIVVFPFFLLLYQVPGIKHMEDQVYAWVAKHRRFFPGMRPYCERPGAPCST